MPKLFKNKWFLLCIIMLCLRILDLHLPARAYAKVHVAMGEKAEAKSQMKRANDHYLKAAQYDPTTPRPYYKLAELSQKSNDEDSKIAYYQKAVEIGSDVNRMKVWPYNRRDREYAQACYEVGMANKKNGHIAMAIRLFGLSINHYSPFTPSAYQLGLIYDELNDPTKTLYYIREVYSDIENRHLAQELKALALRHHPDWERLF